MSNTYVGITNQPLIYPLQMKANDFYCQLISLFSYLSGDYHFEKYIFKSIRFFFTYICIDKMPTEASSSSLSSSAIAIAILSLFCLHMCWFLYLFLGCCKLLLPAVMYSYTNLRMRLSFILNKCCFHLGLWQTMIMKLRTEPRAESK